MHILISRAGVRSGFAASEVESGRGLSCVPGGRPNALRMRNAIDAQSTTPLLHFPSAEVTAESLEIFLGLI